MGGVGPGLRPQKGSGRAVRTRTWAGCDAVGKG